MLANITAPQRERQCKDKLAAEVGIIFLVEVYLYIDATVLNEAEGYGDFLIHSKGHDEYWDQLRQAGAVRGEYDEMSRARVAYSIRTHKFTLLADRCILQQPEAVAKP